MKKTLLSIVIILTVGVLAGCSSPKKTPAPGAETPAAEKQAVTADQAPGIPAADYGSISGSVSFDNPKDFKGNLFIFIMQNEEGPGEYKVLSHTLIPAKDVNPGGTSYRLENVPPGEHAVIAIWDTNEPFCDKSAPICEASARDGLGMSPPAVVEPGKAAENIVVMVY